jgi:protoporphyrinogen oxidase
MNEASNTIETLILGAGLTGLSCAHHLADPQRFRLIEREKEVGGLAKTRKRPGGFLCDGTGHWLHLKNPKMKTLVNNLLGDNLEARSRRARVYSKGSFTLYPFQANTYGLPKEVIAECLNGLIQAKFVDKHPEPKNYLEWIRATFGDGICKHFMEPYNEKIYGVPLDTLASDFAKKYIPQPNLKSVIDGALGLSKEALGYNAQFVYPKKGGIGALANAFHDSIDRPAEYERLPRSIDVQAKSVVMNDGEIIHYQHLVNTIPLPDLIKLAVAGNAAAVPESVIEAAQKLRANSVFYFDVAIKGDPSEHQDYHWIYLPESEFPFYRVGSYSAVERSLAPAGCRSYYVEFGHYGEVDTKTFEQPLIDGLIRLGLLKDESEIIFMIPNVLSPAYVLFDDNYEVSRKTVLDWCDHVGLITKGRYGLWQYNAMEDALREGQEAADQITESKA